MTIQKEKNVKNIVNTIHHTHKHKQHFDLKLLSFDFENMNFSHLFMLSTENICFVFN